MTDASDRFAENPFFVLALLPTATRAEIERAGQKWLAMLDVGVSAAKIYATPVGPRVRTPELVRGAMAELRDPERRLAHELWCASELAEPVVHDEPEPQPDSRDETFCFDALTALAWQR